jgi:hypothetical protein
LKKIPSFQVLIYSACLIFFSNCADNDSNQLKYGDAHTHLTTYGEAALDSLYKYGIKVVRDCGGNIHLLKKWREAIAGGERRGPEIYFAGPMLDGRRDDNDPDMRVAVFTPDQAKNAVDSLAGLGVDFIKTHAALTADCYFAILGEARKKNIKVVSHMPGSVPVWAAADSGLSCVEHAAESILTAPISAGLIKSSGDSAVFAAMDWWHSAQGDSVIQHLGRLKIYYTPTLFAYKLWCYQGKDQPEIDSRLKVFSFLKQVTLRLYKAGVIILAGTDLYDTSWQHETPGLSLFKEMRVLEEAGLTKQAAIDAATVNLQNWLDSCRR